MRIRPRQVLFGSIVVLTAVWAVAFTSIYRRPHSRVEASRWIYQNVPATATIATEHWDDALPLAVGRDTPAQYQHVELKLYDEETETKRRELIAALDAADVIVLSSNRLYRSIPRVPWKYPLGRRYYELLFAGELGFQVERVFTSYPGVAGLEIPDDDAEEAQTVYDHPKVLVFRKTDRYRHDRVALLFNAVSLSNIVRIPPNQYSALYRRARPPVVALAGERAARVAVTGSSAGSLAALERWVIVLEALSLALFAILFRPLAAGADRGYGFAKVLAWLAPGTAVWLLASAGVAPHRAATARGVSALIVAWGAWTAWRRRAELGHWFADATNRRGVVALEGVFLGTFALFAAIRALNPAIAWGEKPMDFAILNALLRSPAMPPPDPWFAGESLNYFYFGHALTSVLANAAGVAAPVAFNLAIPTVAALLSAAAFIFIRQVSARVAVAVIGALALVLVGNLAGPQLLASGKVSKIGFDYFWATSRVIPNTINEFPLWNLVFADLHAHVLAMPFEVTLLYLGTLWTARGLDGERMNRVLLGLLIAWLLGTVAATSAWSVPGTVALQIGFLVTAWRTTSRSWRGLVAALATGIAIVVLARAMFWPFSSQYTAPAGQWGWVRAESASLAQIVTIFGIFFIIVVPQLAARVVRRDECSLLHGRCHQQRRNGRRRGLFAVARLWCIRGDRVARRGDVVRR